MKEEDNKNTKGVLNILNIPVVYISFNKLNNLEKDLYANGFTNIKHFPAVNGRKLNVNELLDNNIISIRGYHDIIYGRSEHDGLSSIGAVGCTLSHFLLWNYCIENKLEYITIIEEDAEIMKFTNKDIKNIENILKKPNSIFISTKIKNDIKNSPINFFGTHFYIASNKACQNLIKKTLPIEIQVDSYISHIKNLKEINIEGYSIIKQKSHKSTIQDKCVKCNLPKSYKFYIGVIIGVILIIIIAIFFIYKSYKYKNNLTTYKNKNQNNFKF
jgi:GR25 family glycosyltransferase involved in LPS biosynthesis